MKYTKYIIAALAAAFCAYSAKAQDMTAAQKAAAEAAKVIVETPEQQAPVEKPHYWANTLLTNLNFLQAAYSSWAKGGDNSVAMTAYIDANANYSKEKAIWKNRLQLDYGFLYSQDKPIMQKTKDRMLLESTLGYRAAKNLNYAAKFTYLSQFSNGYQYGTPAQENPSKQDWKDARTLKSGLFSPAVFTLGLGIDYTLGKWLTVNFSPVTGGFTVVTDEALRLAYGMDKKSSFEDVEPQKDAHGLLTNGDIFRAARFEFGTQLTADARVIINENFDISSHLILFSNYLDNPQNVRVNWDNRFIWKISKYFTLNVNTTLIYDDTVLIMDDDYPDGHRTVQFNEALQFGFIYTFKNKTAKK